MSSPVPQVIPYLLRRAHENSDMVAKGAGSEMGVIRREIMRRMGGALLLGRQGQQVRTTSAPVTTAAHR